MNKCDLCSDPIYPVIWKNNKFRLVEIDDPSYSAYYRVEHIQHVKEMTDLEEKDRMELMQVVFTVESAIRTCYKPDKINLASLGNLTPHIHWHIIPRFKNDNHYPGSIWSKQKKFEKTKISTQIKKNLNAIILENLNQ